MAPPIRTYAEACRLAAAVYSRALTRIAHQSDEEAARAAYVPGGRSVEELTEYIRSLRAATRTRQRAA